MHVLFVHQNFPAQFGHVAARLVRDHGWRCTFVSTTPAGEVAGIEKIRYVARGGAGESTHYCSRTFENGIWHAAGVYEALKPLRERLRPDVVVGHSGFGSTLFLPEILEDVPIVNYFEFFYRPHGSDIDFRRDFPPPEPDILRARARNAMILLDLEGCSAGYTPTHYQWGRLPKVYRQKVRVVHDGIDTDFWGPSPVRERRIGPRTLGPHERVVTYVARGLESMRGFDIFMRVAKRICDRRPDVTFLVVGSDRVAYGGDLKHTGGISFKDWVLGQEDYDLDRVLFVGNVPPDRLVHLLNFSDLHVYLTVPFVLSWSLLDAMSCGCVVLASDTEPVREVVEDRRNGLLEGFFDVEGLADRALEVLADPAAFRGLGDAARRTIVERYDVRVTLPRLIALLEEAGSSS